MLKQSMFHILHYEEGTINFEPKTLQNESFFKKAIIFLEYSVTNNEELL